jgi:phosphatidylinositol 4-kinase
MSADYCRGSLYKADLVDRPFPLPLPAWHTCYKFYLTTLYTLGNVLSSGSNTERALAGGINGDLAMDGSVNPTFYIGKQSTGSSISLTISGEEETSVVYGNVVQAICGIASSCNEPKITALAQSMLQQKIDKVSRSVDARIIIEAAGLALSGGPLEFRSLLKLYAKISHDGVMQNNEVLLGAVSQNPVYTTDKQRMITISTGDERSWFSFVELA